MMTTNFFQKLPGRVISLLACLLLLSGCLPTSSSTNNVDTQTFTNPLMNGTLKMGDPFVLTHDGQYYLYGTNDSNRGFIAWQSTDLVYWDSIGYIYEKTDTSYGQSSFWAPEVFNYKPHDQFYMVYSTKHDDETGLNICLAASDNPKGPFRDIYTPWIPYKDWQRIDGHVFIDIDETPYLYFDKVGVVGEPWAEPSTGYLYGMIYVVKLSRDLSKALSDPVLCIQADQPWENPNSMHSRCNEGSFVFNRDGIYYMTYSANHYADPSYGIGYATAPSPLGPWTKNRSNPLVSTDTLIACSGPGHNSFAYSPSGTELWMVYHTHADWKKPSGRRTVNIDRIRFDDNGTLYLEGPTRSSQAMPK